jgi:hypothetical protein
MHNCCSILSIASGGQEGMTLVKLLQDNWSLSLLKLHDLIIVSLIQ